MLLCMDMYGTQSMGIRLATQLALGNKTQSQAVPPFWVSEGQYRARKIKEVTPLLTSLRIKMRLRAADDSEEILRRWSSRQETPQNLMVTSCENPCSK